jgi:ADP-heptose:LPS heptosyltransferase
LNKRKQAARSNPDPHGGRTRAFGLGADRLPGYADWPGGRRLDNKGQRALFEASNRLTEHFPRAGSRVLDWTFRPVAGSRWLSVMLARRNRRVMQGLKSFQRFLIIPDIHIGDAVMSQTALTAIRDFFPAARVDYLANRTAFPLVEGNPEATRVLPFFSNGVFPSAADLAALHQLIRDERYDLALSFCPYISGKDAEIPGTGLVNIMSIAPVVVRNMRRPAMVNHFAYQTYGFMIDLLSLIARPQRPAAFPGLQVRIGDAAVDEARRFAEEAGLPAGKPIVMLNPDAASPFTRIPDEILAELLALLVRLDAVILVGAGHSEAGIGQRIVATLPPSLLSGTRIVPASLSLEAFTALVDLCDVFVTGDTGPMHLAAARKLSRSGRHHFRNRTAVLSIFGATPARLSGYDSLQPGYLPADQAAPSWSYTAGSPCRNITCLNKVFKTCRDVRCFDEVDVEALAGLIREYVNRPDRR